MCPSLYGGEKVAFIGKKPKMLQFISVEIGRGNFFRKPRGKLGEKTPARRGGNMSVHKDAANVRPRGGLSGSKSNTALDEKIGSILSRVKTNSFKDFEYQITEL